MRSQQCDRSISYNVCIMRKDAPLSFRIPGDLKSRLLRIADREARSISQTCELLLTIGADGYEKEGSKYLHRHMAAKKSAKDE
jgi:hypothetical protein